MILNQSAHIFSLGYCILPIEGLTKTKLLISVSREASHCLLTTYLMWCLILCITEESLLEHGMSTASLLQRMLHLGLLLIKIHLMCSVWGETFFFFMRGIQKCQNEYS